MSCFDVDNIGCGKVKMQGGFTVCMHILLFNYSYLRYLFIPLLERRSNDSIGASSIAP